VTPILRAPTPRPISPHLACRAANRLEVNRPGGCGRPSRSDPTPMPLSRDAHARDLRGRISVRDPAPPGSDRGATPHPIRDAPGGVRTFAGGVSARRGAQIPRPGAGRPPSRSRGTVGQLGACASAPRTGIPQKHRRTAHPVPRNAMRGRAGSAGLLTRVRRPAPGRVPSASIDLFPKGSD
jgi:hypothetical protein